MLIGQAGSISGKTRQEVEMMQQEQENSGKEEVDSSHSCPDHRSSRMWLAPLKKVLNHMANIDQKKWVNQDVRVSQWEAKANGPISFITYRDLCVIFFGAKQLWKLGRTENPNKQAPSCYTPDLSQNGSGHMLYGQATIFEL